MRKLFVVMTVALTAMLAAPFAVAGMLVLIDADERYATEDTDAAGSKDTID